MKYPCECRGAMGIGMGRVLEYPLEDNGEAIGAIRRYVCDACGATASERQLFGHIDELTMNIVISDDRTK